MSRIAVEAFDPAVHRDHMPEVPAPDRPRKVLVVTVRPLPPRALVHRPVADRNRPFPLAVGLYSAGGCWRRPLGV